MWAVTGGKMLLLCKLELVRLDWDRLMLVDTGGDL